MVPLQKPGDPYDVSNLRAISLLPLPGKILECIVHIQVSKYLEDDEALSPHQSGFRKAFDTVDHIILCKKVKYYGLHPDTILWTNSYLDDGNQIFHSKIN